MSKNDLPNIKPGMKISEVVKLLGKNYRIVSGNEVLNYAKGGLIVGGKNQLAESGIWVFSHPAGEYWMMVQDGHVIDVGRQPTEETRQDKFTNTVKQKKSWWKIFREVFFDR